MVKNVEVRGEEGCIVCIVNGECVETGGLSHVDVGAIIRTWTAVQTGRLELDHIVGENHGGSRTLGQLRVGMGVGVRVRVSVMKT